MAQERELNVLAGSPSRSVVRKQASAEPRRGKCDAVVVTSLPVQMSQEGVNHTKAAYQKFGLVVANLEKSDDSKADDNGPYKYSHRPWMVGSDDPASKVPFSETATSTVPSESAPQNPSTGASESQLVVQYKKPKKDAKIVLNRARMYLVASVPYLDAIGVIRYPVFALATHGTKGGVMMAWKAQNGVSRPLFPYMICILSSPLQLG